MNFDKIINQIPVIEDGVNYWMVRTSGGRYYEQFVNNNKIAMGRNYIQPADILKFPRNRKEFIKRLSPIIERNTDSKRPGLTATQFYRFYFEIKKNDIVIIPSTSSSFLTIGRVTEDIPKEYEFITKDEKVHCDHIHTRNIEWVTTKSRWQFNPNFVSLLYAHNTIVDANDYKDYINAVVYDFFIQGNSGHLIININTVESIKARTLFYLFFELLDFTEEYFEEPLDANDINIRINLNSPGKVELISKNLTKLSLVGMLVVTIAGGNFKAGNIEVGTEGLLKPILEFINEQDERKNRVELIYAALNDLEISQPRELAQIIHEARVAKK